MARRRFGADLTAVAWRTVTVDGTAGVVQLAPGVTGITAWTAETGGTQVTDLTAPGGSALSGGLIAADAYGRLDFFGPATTPETVTLWLDAGLGVRQLIAASDLPAQVQAIAAAINSLVLTIANAPAGSVFVVDEIAGTYVRPTSRTDVVIRFRGVSNPGAFAVDNVDEWARLS